MKTELLKLLGYKSWANKLTLSSLSGLPNTELCKKRATNFGNIPSTLNHVYVVDDIFKAHLLGESHGYTSRNSDCPSLSTLAAQQYAIDQWYIDFVNSLKPEQLSQVIRFEFVGGGEGSMSISDIIFHIVNHGTYHRGFVSDMMYQIPLAPPANDLPVYLRDIEYSTVT